MFLPVKMAKKLINEKLRFDRHIISNIAVGYLKKSYAWLVDLK